MVSTRGTRQTVGGLHVPTAMTAIGQTAGASDLIRALRDVSEDEAALIVLAVDLLSTVTDATVTALAVDQDGWAVGAASSVPVEAMAALGRLSPSTCELGVVELGGYEEALLLTWPGASSAILVIGDIGVHRPFVDLLATTVGSLMIRRELSGQLADLAEEQLLLMLPERVYCREACKGLCAHCGANLNDGPCLCVPDKRDHPFAGMMDLLNKPPEGNP